MYSGLDRVRVPQVIDELFLARSEKNPSSLTDQRRMLMQKRVNSCLLSQSAARRRLLQQYPSISRNNLARFLRRVRAPNATPCRARRGFRLQGPCRASRRCQKHLRVGPWRRFVELSIGGVPSRTSAQPATGIVVIDIPAVLEINSGLIEFKR